MTKWNLVTTAKDFVERNISKRKARYKRRRNLLAKRLRQDSLFSQRVIPNKHKLMQGSRAQEKQMVRDIIENESNQ